MHRPRSLNGKAKLLNSLAAQCAAKHRKLVELKFLVVRRIYPDFDERTAGIPFSSVIRFLLIERIPCGLQIGYLLSLPEHAKTLGWLLRNTKESRDEEVCLRRLEWATAKLAAFSLKLLRKGLIPMPARENIDII